MLIVLSPAKSLDYTTPPTTDLHTLPDYISHSAELVEVLKRLSPAEVGGLMHISDALAHLNATRFSSWSPTFSKANAKQAILAFNGDVYTGFDAGSLSHKELAYTQKHVRILSGLYGMLRPLDLMQPYRLEMGTKLVNAGGKNLYAFWHDTVTLGLNEELAKLKTDILVNLASDEYFKVVRPKVLAASIVAPVFEDWKNGKYKIISFYAKRARGLMARYATVNKVTNPEQLKDFNVEGYQFVAKDSDAGRWVFRRRIDV
ncbi:peroxide stress protein YaaA [Glaciimonas immobilis]|uniref:UPF0246 protein HNR39_001010 n=1 Tax=Glaciimonas immobilis TaxID=728004 RepID=A0A840RN43_9BURK|nr:peroxide stress protein YaaA [Glaciimonas immobilis]KAF3998116.1 peroxide stress protein YaaA [Glaciimonas immobilis]MBB5199183.1 hypothetical protein [Glaciimonas immobilis]